MAYDTGTQTPSRTREGNSKETRNQLRTKDDDWTAPLRRREYNLKVGTDGENCPHTRAALGHGVGLLDVQAQARKSKRIRCTTLEMSTAHRALRAALSAVSPDQRALSPETPWPSLIMHAPSMTHLALRIVLDTPCTIHRPSCRTTPNIPGSTTVQMDVHCSLAGVPH